jgi:hypothetical protein
MGRKPWIGRPVASEILENIASFDVGGLPVQCADVVLAILAPAIRRVTYLF